jgi:hypothetical protein
MNKIKGMFDIQKSKPNNQHTTYSKRIVKLPKTHTKNTSPNKEKITHPHKKEIGLEACNNA